MGRRKGLKRGGGVGKGESFFQAKCNERERERERERAAMSEADSDFAMVEHETEPVEGGQEAAAMDEGRRLSVYGHKQ